MFVVDKSADCRVASNDILIDVDNYLKSSSLKVISVCNLDLSAAINIYTKYTFLILLGDSLLMYLLISFYKHLLILKVSVFCDEFKNNNVNYLNVNIGDLIYNCSSNFV